MGGVAYTTGSEIDDEHKEIHFSTDYIGGISPERVQDEILGVVRHEMVSTYGYAQCFAGWTNGTLWIGSLLAV